MFATIRRFAVAPILLAVLLTAACNDDPTEPDDPAADLATIRLTIGTQIVNITEGGGGNVTIGLGATNVAATFLDAGGGTLAIPASEFELRFESSNTARVTFSRTSAFAGTLIGLSAGTATIQVTLWHLEEDHGDFGPQNLNVTVQ